MCRCGMWDHADGLGSAGKLVGLSDLRELVQSKSSCDSEGLADLPKINSLNRLYPKG